MKSHLKIKNFIFSWKPTIFEIPNTVEFENEISFLNSYKVDIANKDNVLRAKTDCWKISNFTMLLLKIKTGVMKIQGLDLFLIVQIFIMIILMIFKITFILTME